AEAMAGDAFEFFWAAFQNKECHRDADKVGRARHSNFRVATDDDSVGMMAGVGPAPGRGFAGDHEGRDFVNHIVHPDCAKGGAVSAFVPARIGGRTVEKAVSDKKWRTPPRAPEVIAEESGQAEQREPE